MKKMMIALAMLAGAAGATGAQAQTNLSLTIGQPGFYGRLDIGDFGPPPVYFAEPIIVERVVRREPLYLRVPPGHRNKWSKHCRRYNACGRPVYFVRDEWYTNTYAPRYREMHYRDEPRRVEYRPVERREVHVVEYRDDDRGHGHGKHKDKGHKDKGHKGHGKHKD